MFNNEKLDIRVKFTRDLTFEALVTLLKEKLYTEIKISDIIKQAGISRATFYCNFTSKDDVVLFRVSQVFQDFHKRLIVRYQNMDDLDEQFLIRIFFEMVDRNEKVIDTVIRSNLEYCMVDGILRTIQYHRERFYELVKTDKKSEDYTMEIVSSSVWTLLSRWHKTGKEETPSQLAQIYMSTFKSVYIALFEDRQKLLG